MWFGGLRRRVLVLAVAAVVCSAVISSGTAEAQREDILSGDKGEVCRENPHAEECICFEVSRYGNVPAAWVEVSAGVPAYPPRAVDADWDGELKSWVRTTPMPNPTPPGYVDPLRTEANSKYKAHCSLSYFRENLRRLWYFLLALGASLTAVTLGWAGFVHMQDSASGETRSMSRTIIIRAALGMILLACVFFAWEGVSDLFVGEFEIWSDRPGLLEGF